MSVLQRQCNLGFIQFISKLGELCGHTGYGVAKSKIITILHASVLSNMAYSKDEKRYKRLLCTVDLTRNIFFSYSFHIMHTLQRNMSNNKEGHTNYESMFVWNEYLTRRIHNKRLYVVSCLGIWIFQTCITCSNFSKGLYNFFSNI
ncbi:hypothetical protein ARALYDRAFT_916890 [Arabidopsis lyrata subsp. lyrata]|uniref:SAC domain-containing protein n=1 Tax=Arabidopsis lyrata subsp. lyrata TaxID=81972 RepID=D7MTC7_ARALL|nr:hypothetical protein ARALYDRAFT_916890 [Arabidopsis lyrata subsp. lyrata]